MLRVSVRKIKPGMVLGRTVFDVRGHEVAHQGSKMDEESVSLLSRSGVSDVLIEDPRMADVPVGFLYPAAVEAQAVKSIHVLLAVKQGMAEPIEASDISPIQTAVHKLAESLFPVAMGEPDLSGMNSQDGYDYVHPAKVAGIAMLIARETGLDKEVVANVGMVAMLMNLGYLALPAGTFDFDDYNETMAPSGISDSHKAQIKTHPKEGVAILKDSGLDAEVVRGVREHHERWNGSGYPDGRKGDEVSVIAQIVAMADTYHSLVSTRPDRRAFKPHEAVEFIVAFSGELYNPELAQVFARRVPQYPAGVGVILNTGEVAIVSDPNIGHIARPIVRICTKDGRPLKKPYDRDLSLAEHMRILITEVLL